MITIPWWIILLALVSGAVLGALVMAMVQIGGNADVRSRETIRKKQEARIIIDRLRGIA